MGKGTKHNGNGSSGKLTPTPKVSQLGQRLREIREQALAKGMQTLSFEEIQRRVLEARGGMPIK